MGHTVLVTGAAGFIGSHLCDRLIAAGAHVVGIDNFNDYYSPAQKRANVEAIRSADREGRFELVEADIRSEVALTALFEKHHFDGIAHLAAMAGVRASMDAPELYFDVNLTGTLKLLEQARALSPMPNFVLASTSSVYGPTETIPFVESDPADQPLAPYPASKRAAELLAHAYHHLYGLPLVALRFFTVYGPRGRPDMMPLKLLRSVYQGETIPLYNGGNMSRDWTYVSDIVAGVEAALRVSDGFHVVNLGRGEPLGLNDFIELVCKTTGKKPKLVSEPAPRTDMIRTYADVSKARELCGYDPKVSVEDGVRKLVEWYEACL